MKTITITIPTSQIPAGRDLSLVCHNFSEKKPWVPVRICKAPVPDDRYSDLKIRGNLKSAIGDLDKIHMKLNLFSENDYRNLMKLAAKDSGIAVTTQPLIEYSDKQESKISVLNISYDGLSEFASAFRSLVLCCSEVDPDPLELTLKFGENAERVDLAEKARRYSEENCIPYGDALEIVSMPKKAGK